VSQAVAAVALRPVTATLTEAADVPVLIILTAIDPSTFVKAVVLKLPPDVPTLTAPGRTVREYCPNAQRRLDGW
jgi:hypothetical protein